MIKDASLSAFSYTVSLLLLSGVLWLVCDVSPVIPDISVVDCGCILLGARILYIFATVKFEKEKGNNEC